MDAHPPVPHGADRLVVVFSDIEMGAGGRLDDFPHTDFLAELILRYNEPPYAELAVELVFNGDTFDLLKTSWRGAHPHLITAEVAVGKMARIADAHPAFFAALGAFLEHPHAERRVHFIIGNHDADLLFEEVQALVAARIGPHGPVGFPGYSLEIGDAYVEHGQQVDILFAMQTPGFVMWQGERVLELPWASVALLEVAMPLLPVLHHHDRLKPREEAFRLLPEARDYVIGAFWAYWRRDLVRGWLRGSDPVKHVSWTMLRELAHRFSTRDGLVSVADHFERRLRTDTAHRVILFGHEHEAGWWTWGGRKLLRTGAFRNEYMLEDEGRIQRPIPKSWAEVYQVDGRTVRAGLVETEGPPAPDGYVPASIFSVLDDIRPQLGTDRERAEVAAAERAQADREKSEG